MKKLTIFAVGVGVALSCAGVTSQTTQAAEGPYISVGTARAKKSVVAFPIVKTSNPTEAALAKEIHQTITNDLIFMDLFRLLPETAFIENTKTAGLTPDQFKLSDWTTIGTEFLIKTGVSVEGKTLTFEAFAYDVSGSKQLIGKRYVATTGEARLLAHTFANQFVERLTGLPGIFLTKIAMVCDRNGKKELYQMNFDGTDTRQITKHHSIAFSPAWSPDGKKLAYSVYTKRKNNVKNIDLYEYDFTKETVRRLSNRTGINSGAAYSPDGSKIALTMSFLGNPDVFTLDPKTLTVERLTKSFGFDVDPAWSPDGRHLAFVSSRTGMPMVFRMNADGGDVKRLTFAGRYNATPSWSPQNNKIAFSGWIDGRFDVFTMNPDGTTIERLTKNQGNNEDPSFSPDGNFLVFSSNRTGQKQVYVMNIDGTFAKRMTFGLGNCTSPKWSNPPSDKK